MYKRKIFISYSSEDRQYYEALVKHLTGLERSGLIEHWSDNEILPGMPWDKAVKKQLQIADIIIFLVSSDFINSDYINDIEINKAIKRYNKREVIIVPIIARICDFESLALHQFQALPTHAKPISTWDDKDAAWLNVLDGLKKLINQIECKPPFSPKILFILKMSIFISIICLFLFLSQDVFKEMMTKLDTVAEKPIAITEREVTSTNEQNQILQNSKPTEITNNIVDNKATEKEIPKQVSENIPFPKSPVNKVHPKTETSFCKQKGSVKLEANNQPATGATIMFDDEEDLVCIVNKIGKFSIQLLDNIEGKQILLTIKYKGSLYERWKKVCNNRIDIKI